MNIKDLAKEAGLKRHQEQAPGIDGAVGSWEELEQFALLVAAQTRARCIELVLAGTAMPVQTRTLEALQRDRKRIAALIEEDGK
jgi:hypothetical protein